MFEGWTSPFAETQRQASDRDAAWNVLRNDPGAAALLAGLSMLANNNGQRSVGQLVGQAGADALAGANALAAEQRARQRQQLLLAGGRENRGQAESGARHTLRSQPSGAGPSGAQRAAVSAAGQDTEGRTAAQDAGSLAAAGNALREPSGPYQPRSPYLPDGALMRGGMEGGMEGGSMGMSGSGTNAAFSGAARGFPAGAPAAAYSPQPAQGVPSLTALPALSDSALSLPGGQHPAGGGALARAAAGGAQSQDVQARLDAMLQAIQALQASLAGGASPRGVQPLSGAL